MINTKGPIHDLWEKFLEDVYGDIGGNQQDDWFLERLKEAFYASAAALYHTMEDTLSSGDHEASEAFLASIEDDINQWTDYVSQEAEAIESGIH